MRSGAETIEEQENWLLEQVVRFTERVEVLIKKSKGHRARSLPLSRRLADEARVVLECADRLGGLIRHPSRRSAADTALSSAWEELRAAAAAAARGF